MIYLNTTVRIGFLKLENRWLEDRVEAGRLVMRLLQ